MLRLPQRPSCFLVPAGLLLVTLGLSGCGLSQPLNEPPAAGAGLGAQSTGSSLMNWPVQVDANGNGPVERNASSGGERAGDGRPLSLGGRSYPLGYGVAANSGLTFALDGQCTRLTTTIGMDDEVGQRGRVVFEVYADGQRLYNSGVMTGASAPKSINLSLSGRRTLSLVVTGQGTAADNHADWAMPTLIGCAPASQPVPQPMPVTPPTTPPVSAPTAVPASVTAYGARCDGATDDSVAIQRALDSEASVYVPVGTCVAGNLKLRSNQTISGAGTGSVLLQKKGADFLISANPGQDGTPNVADNLRNIRLDNFKLRGQSGQVAFDEHVHLLNLNAVSDVVISNMAFEGYVGDGLYLGSGARLAERHNERVKVLDSVFDGVTKNNRNGISIIDGTDIEIRGTRFTRSGRQDMPGAIDVEPDAENDAFSRIRNITIDDCEFRDIGANALIALLLRPQDRLHTPSNNITISRIRGYGNNQTGQTGLALTHSSWGATEVPGDQTPPLNLTVSDSSFDGIYRPFLLTQMKGAVIRNTTFANARAFAAIGQGLSTSFNRDITLDNVVFDHVGYDASVGYKSLTIYSNDGVTLNNVTVRRGMGLGIAFSTGRSRDVRISHSKIINDSNQLVYGIKRFTDHTLTASTNLASDIQLVGVQGNDFVGH